MADLKLTWFDTFHSFLYIICHGCLFGCENRLIELTKLNPTQSSVFHAMFFIHCFNHMLEY